MVSRNKDNNTVNPYLASFNNNIMTNLDEFNTGYIDKPEVTMEIRADDGESFSVQKLLDPGSYSLYHNKCSLNDKTNIVSHSV